MKIYKIRQKSTGKFRGGWFNWTSFGKIYRSGPLTQFLRALTPQRRTDLSTADVEIVEYELKEVATLSVAEWLEGRK